MRGRTKSKTRTPAKGRPVAQAATCTSELKSALWDAANTLRGSAVDRTDWKGYILPLLFFKRISDVWDEETAEAQEMYGDADPSLFPEVHRFIVPEGCHWNDVRDVATNVGTALRRAMQEIERANPDTLFRVFGNADWGDKEKFSDELLKDLTEGFSGIDLGNSTASTDALGDAYEYLVGKFADVTRRNKAGEFYTPRSVVRMMVEILDPREGESIYDPACGTGGMLLGAIEHVVRKGGDPRTFYGKIYGQEKNLTTSAIARMNVVLHGIEDFQIAREDTLRSPAFTDSSTGGLGTFDCVIANPPFSLKEWGRELWEADPWSRASFGIPPESYGDYAFVQHMIASMTRTGNGRMAVVLPQGALFRKAADPDPTRKAKEIAVKLTGRLRIHAGNPKYKALAERLEDLKKRHEQGLLLSIDFLKELLELAKDVVKTERETPVEEDIDRGKAALTELFEEARNGETPVMIRRIVDDIDEIVRAVRFDGWQATHAGEREVKNALRRTLFKYKLHQDAELFERAYRYIREYY